MTLRPAAALFAALLLSAAAQQRAPRAASPEETSQSFRPIRVGDPESLAYTAELFPGADHDPAVPGPEEVLGQPLGSRAARPQEVVRYLELLADASPRVELRRHGLTFEGRPLVHAVVASPDHLAHLDEITGDLAALLDPRGHEDRELAGIIETTPAVAWLAACIHGDELSGTDGSLALAHHLAASRSQATRDLLERVVVVIDPLMNPDGRARFLAQVAENAGYQPALSQQGMARGRWPWGRGNHYLFDMNRDWMPGVCPETRARWAAVRSFVPQLFVDAHEMGELDTFLFSPPRAPIHPHLLVQGTRWPAVFARAQAHAFDQHGWSYYTREWFESWYPGYSDSWASFGGAVGILYEQAGYSGQPIRRASGEIATYREAVHHQAVSALADLEALAQHRSEVLADFLSRARANLAPETPGNQRLFVLIPGRHPDREDRLVRALAGQGIECRRAEREFTGHAAVSALGVRVDQRSFPAGALVVSPRQPMGSLAKAYLELDPHLADEDLLDERRELEQKNESRVYDVTAWNLPQAYDLDAWWCDWLDVGSEPVGALPPAASESPQAEPPATYGWAVDGQRDASLAFAVAALEAGMAVHLSDEEFTVGERGLARGSLLVRRAENPRDDLDQAVERCARAAGVGLVPLATALSPDEGPDLGGGHFHLLERPRVALVGNSPVQPDAYGHLWYLLDAELGLPLALLDAQAQLAWDLRPFNVVVLPPGAGSGEFLERQRDALEAWVRSGGTLIAMEDSAAALTGPEDGLSAVRLRRDVLGELDTYRWAAWRDRRAARVSIDPERVWGDPRPRPSEDAREREEGPRPESETPAAGPEDGPAASPVVERPAGPSDEDWDHWLRRFAPQGVFLRAAADPRAWITVGCASEMPVFFRGDRAFLSPPDVATPVRLAPAEHLRLSGLVWPEAAERIAQSAFVTVERLGHGQIVLFATTPGYRALFRATGRLFENAVVYGPGAGADPPLGW